MLTQTIAGRVYDFSHVVGGHHLSFPIGVAIGSHDAVYVLTRQYERFMDAPWNKTAGFAEIILLTIGDASGEEEFVSQISNYGDADGELIWPAGIALDSNEIIFVTDEWMNRVSTFDKDGNFLGLWGSPGQGDGEFNRPSGIAVDEDDNLLIVDSLNHRVQKFDRDGTYLHQWGSPGSQAGEFDSPWGITVDKEGHVYVADHKNHRVQKFTSDGEYTAQFGSFGTGRGQLNRPTDVAVDLDGDLYVCDWANNRVQIFGPDGRFITSLVGDAQKLAKWQQEQVDANVDVIKARRRVYTLEPEWRFALPTALVFDEAKQRVLVADTQRGRLQIYNKLHDYMEPQFNL